MTLWVQNSDLRSNLQFKSMRFYLDAIDTVHTCNRNCNIFFKDDALLRCLQFNPLDKETHLLFLQMSQVLVLCYLGECFSTL